MNKLTKLLIVAALVLAVAKPSYAWFLDFEWGLGFDGAVVASGIPGLQFTTTDGFDWIYADITTGGYNARSDNGSVYLDGAYWMGGNVSTFLGTSQGSGRIDFLNFDGGYFTTGYSSATDFYLEAYDQLGNLLDATSGPSNLYPGNQTGMDYLTVNSANNDIAYVLMHDSGNFWTVDNMSGDASGVTPPDVVPEPATLLLLGSGLLGLGIFRRRK